MNFEYPPGATPLSREEMEGLKLKHISTHRELNEVEQANITKAEAAYFGRRPKELLTEPFVRKLHKQMLCDVWKWAGIYRTSDKNIGSFWAKVPEEVRKLVDDAQYWIEHKTDPVDDIAVRFHHRLVSIHPFANGNGRHSRLMTDLLLESQGVRRLTWGSGASIDKAGEVRTRYLEALRAADNRDYSLLLRFARS